MTDRSHAFGKFLFVLAWGGVVALGLLHGAESGALARVSCELRARLAHAVEESLARPLEAYGFHTHGEFRHGSR